MTGMTKRFGLVVGAAVVALGLTSVYVSAQNSSGGPGPSWAMVEEGLAARRRTDGHAGTARPDDHGPLESDRRAARSGQERRSRRTASDIKAVGDRAIAAHQALEAVISADTIDESAIRARSADVATVEADMAVMQSANSR